jgi:hypothetical protein
LNRKAGSRGLLANGIEPPPCCGRGTGVLCTLPVMVAVAVMPDVVVTVDAAVAVVSVVTSVELVVSVAVVVAWAAMENREPAPRRSPSEPVAGCAGTPARAAATASSSPGTKSKCI